MWRSTHCAKPFTGLNVGRNLLSLMSILTKGGLRAEALQCYALCERALAEIDLEPSVGLRQAQQQVTDESAVEQVANLLYRLRQAQQTVIG